MQGESLVPQLFYARDAKSRVIFAETNYPDPQRAVITNDYKLIFNMKANVYQLYDLRSDAWEKKNLWGKDQQGGAKMKGLLDEWLDRVYYKRDAGNEAQELRAKLLLPAAPTPQNPVSATFAGAIEVVGWDAASKEAFAGQPLAVTLYLRCAAPTPASYKFTLEARPSGGGPPIVQELAPMDGLFPTTRWKTGDYLKLAFTLKLPPGLPAGPVSLSLTLRDEKRQPAPVTGAAAADGQQVALGSIPLVVAARP
jgi:hypothetical protein